MTEKQPRKEIGVDARFVRQSMQGDKNAYGKLVCMHSRRAYAIAYSVISDFQTAQDITQEAFVRAYSKLGKLQSPEKFGPWMDVITRNLARRALQKRRRGKMSFTDFSDTSLHPLAKDITSTRELEEAINSLPDTYREPLLMRYMGGASYEEIAQRTGTRRNTAEVRVHRAKKILRDSLTSSESHNGSSTKARRR
jgi:RNA polymerase sigma-70 factor (ECF subfamily)